MHPRLMRKFYGWTPDAFKPGRCGEEEQEAPDPCRKCGSDDLELELGRSHPATKKQSAHGGKIGHRCQACRHLNPIKLQKRKAL